MQGEEDKGANMERFVVQLAGLADVFVNDAFGSWQPHASTFYITKYLPSYAGLCMQVFEIRSMVFVMLNSSTSYEKPGYGNFVILLEVCVLINSCGMPGRAG